MLNQSGIWSPLISIGFYNAICRHLFNLKERGVCAPMSIYSIQAECDAFLHETDAAIESQLRYEDAPFDSALEESLAQNVSNISEEYSKKAGEIYKDFNVAYRKKDYNAASKYLNDLENTVRQWDAKLKELPPEKVGRSVIKNTLRILVIIASLALLLFGPFAISGVLPGAMIRLVGHGLPKAVASASALKAGAFAGMIGTTVAGSYTYTKSMTSALTDYANKKLYRQKHGTEQDPNAHNGRYVAEVLLIDQWLKTITKMKKKLQDMQSGK